MNKTALNKLIDAHGGLSTVANKASISYNGLWNVMRYNKKMGSSMAARLSHFFGVDPEVFGVNLEQ